MFTQLGLFTRHVVRGPLLAAVFAGALALSATAKNKGDIGSPRPDGKAVQKGDEWQITGGGADIFGVSDQFFFASNPASGNCLLTVKVMSVGDSGTHDWAKGGLMIRADESVGAPHATIAISHGGTLAFLTRSTPGGDTRSEKLPGKSFPIYLKLEPDEKDKNNKKGGLRKKKPADEDEDMDNSDEAPVRPKIVKDADEDLSN
jgi:hypothetical protein